MNRQIYLLTTMEGIATHQSKFDLWSHATYRTTIEIGFDIRIPRFVEGAIECQVQRIARWRIVTRRKLKLGRGKQSHRIDFLGTLQVIVIAIELARTNFHIGYNDTRTNRWAPTGITDGQIAVNHRIGKCLIIRFAHIDIHTTDIPLVAGLSWCLLCQLEAQLHLTVHSKGVCQIRGVAGLVIIVAVIAEQIADSATLPIEISHHEGITLAHNGRGCCGMDQAVCLTVKSHITHTI